MLHDYSNAMLNVYAEWKKAGEGEKEKEEEREGVREERRLSKGVWNATGHD